MGVGRVHEAQEEHGGGSRGGSQCHSSLPLIHCTGVERPCSQVPQDSVAAVNTVLAFRQAVSPHLVAFSFDDLQPGTKLLIFCENSRPSIIILGGQLACEVCVSKLRSLVRAQSGSVAERELPAHSGFQGTSGLLHSQQVHQNSLWQTMVVMPLA